MLKYVYIIGIKVQIFIIIKIYNQSISNKINIHRVLFLLQGTKYKQKILIYEFTCVNETETNLKLLFLRFGLNKMMQTIIYDNLLI